MNLFINGDPHDYDGPANVTALVATLNLPGPTLLIELNAVALRREEWPTQILADGDRLEIIRIVAGG